MNGFTRSTVLMKEAGATLPGDGVPVTIDNRERDWKRAYISIVTSRNMLVTACPLCKSVSYSIVQAPIGLYSQLLK